MARANLDQPLSMAKDSLLKFNKNIANKYKAGVGLKYLEDYINSGIFENTTKEYLTKYKFKKTTPKDFENLLKSIDVVAISDYGKGFLSNKLLRCLIDIANEKKIPVIVDPKGKDFKKYERATILKPNLKEAFIAANLTEEDDIEIAAKNILTIDVHSDVFKL